MERKVWSFIQNNALIQRGQTVGCAISGGADSVALFLCLQNLSSRYDFSLQALHIEHGIRGGESVRDANYVKALCAEYNVPLHLKRLDVPAIAREQKVGVELAARNARQAYFEKLHTAGIVDVVATAHHMEDNAETLLLHIIRGCGMDGLVGIPARRDFVIRPFLCLHRQEILSYLQKMQMDWMEDTTNSDTAIARNFVRHEVLPKLAVLNPAVVDSLNRIAENLTADRNYLDEVASRLEARIAQSEDGITRIDVAALGAASPAVSARLLRNVLLRWDAPLDAGHVNALMNLARIGRSGSSYDLGCGMRASIEYDILRIAAVENKPIPFETPIALGGLTQLPEGVLEAEAVDKRLAGNALSEYLDLDAIPQTATVRTRRAGDIFHPLHAPGSKKLKSYFIDIKLARAERDRVPLLADGSRILWVIGHRLSEDVAVTAATRRIVHLTYSKG